ncbi:MAG: SIS domain-containing protein, partial [Candidatus Poribacteria bacterium]|nr:SIS domain-containing protein [Candidatus Poribacteria bacterium]
NGGSLCDAVHFAEECTGKFRSDRKPLPAIALGDAGHITCTANDFGFAEIFARPLSALGHPGDLLIVLSTSGNSENVVRAAAVAKSRGMQVFGLLGGDGGDLKQHCDICLIAPGNTADRIQEIHIKVLHILIEHIERLMFPENYG